MHFMFLLKFYFTRRNSHWSNGTVNIQVVFILLNKWNGFSCCFIEASSAIWREIKYLHSKQERARTSKDYIICREITAVLKIAMDAINLELCDSHDYFVGKGKFIFSVSNTQGVVSPISTSFCNDLTFLWNKMTILWNHLILRWNDLTWNEVTLDWNDQIPVIGTQKD